MSGTTVSKGHKERMLGTDDETVNGEVRDPSSMGKSAVDYTSALSSALGINTDDVSNFNNKEELVFTKEKDESTLRTLFEIIVKPEFKWKGYRFINGSLMIVASNTAGVTGIFTMMIGVEDVVEMPKREELLSQLDRVSDFQIGQQAVILKNLDTIGATAINFD